MEVSPGIHQLKVPIPNNPLGYLNAYLIKSDEGCLLIDTGWNVDEAYDALAAQMKEAGVSFADLNYVVITHIHPDHYGLVGRLQHQTGTELVVHETEMAKLTSRHGRFAPRNGGPTVGQDMLEEMGRWLRLNGVPEEVSAARVHARQVLRSMVVPTMPLRLLLGGEHVRLGDFDFEVIWTPGHAPGHICLYERSRRLLFSGDHILPDITPNVSLHSMEDGNPLGDYLSSLEKVEWLAADTVFPAHGEIFTGLRERVIAIRHHHDARVQATLNAIGDGEKTAWEVAPKIPWMDDEQGWEKLSSNHRCMAVTETLAHLELLRCEGALARTQPDGVVYYGVRPPAP